MEAPEREAQSILLLLSLSDLERLRVLRMHTLHDQRLHTSTTASSVLVTLLQLQPAEVPWNGPQPVQVDWGEDHSLILDEEGISWKTGRCPYDTDSTTFMKVSELPCITAMACGRSLFAAIDSDGGL